MDDLTTGTRESQIVRFAALGFTDKEIAEKLSLSPNTIYTYWRRVRARYGSSSRGEAISRYLHESFDHFRTIVESLPDAVVIVQRGSICFASSAVRSLFNQEPQQLIGQNIGNWLTTEQLSVADDRNVRFGSARTTSCLCLAKRPSGSAVAVILNSIPIEWQGKPASLTLLRQAGTEHLVEEDLNQAMADADTLPDLMAIVDLAGTCLDCRAGHSGQRLATCETAIGKHYRDVVPSFLASALDEALRQLREGGLEVSVQAKGPDSETCAARCSKIREDRVLVLIRTA